MAKRAWGLLGLGLLVLAGCVSPQPLQSPLAFDSPLPPPAHTVYMPSLQAARSPRGVSLACGYEDLDRLAREVAALQVVWVWNWRTNPPLFADIESVPALWDGSVIGQSLGGNSAWLLGFNEPDRPDQANMTPEAAARAWAQVEQIYPERKLASPQPVEPGSRWLERWYAAYKEQNDGRPPRLDALAIHTYWDGTLASYQDQVRYYIDLAARWGVPEVWITEFAFAPGLDRTLRDTVGDMRAYIAWLDAQPTVTRYAPWTNRVECLDIVAPNSQFDTPLYSASGALTALGKMYVGAATVLSW